MKLRIRVALATIALGTVSLLGLTACGTAAAGAVLSPEASVLNAMGFSTDELAPAEAGTPAPNASATAGTRAGNGRHLRRDRLFLRKNTLHGEVVVKTRDGNKTVDVQRGAVTAVTGTSVTVKSSDGFTLTWTTNDKTRVAQNKAKVALSAVKVGENIGIAGLKDGNTTTARLIVIAAS